MLPFELSHYSPILIRIGLAFLIGGAIGFEREMRGQPAGLRTHILVCLGATLLAIVDSVNPLVQGKIAAQVVTGVGFLGAGTILRTDRGVQTHGLTTAASIWCTSAIGIALGYGGVSIWIGICTAFILFITLTLVGTFENFALDKRKNRVLDVYLSSPNADSTATAAADLVDSLSNAGISIMGLRADQPAPDSLIRILHINVYLQVPSDSDVIAKLLTSNLQVSQFHWDKV